MDDLNNQPADVTLPEHTAAPRETSTATPADPMGQPLPDGKIGNAAARLTQTLAASHSLADPLPDPRQIAAYDALHPGATARILTMAENALHMRKSEQAHVQAMQAKEAAYAREGLRLGAALAFTIVLGLVLIAVLGMVILEDSRTSIVATTALGGFGALGLVGVLVNGKRLSDKPDSTAPRSTGRRQRTTATPRRK